MTSPITEFICLCLRGMNRETAGKEARRLGVRLDWARFYFENVRRV